MTLATGTSNAIMEFGGSSKKLKHYNPSTML